MVGARQILNYVSCDKNPQTGTHEQMKVGNNEGTIGQLRPLLLLHSVAEVYQMNTHLSVHPNELIASLTEPPTHKRLRRYWPHGLLVRF
jgi:hypothetical protein